MADCYSNYVIILLTGLILKSGIDVSESPENHELGLPQNLQNT